MDTPIAPINKGGMARARDAKAPIIEVVRATETDLVDRTR